MNGSMREMSIVTAIKISADLLHTGGASLKSEHRERNKLETQQNSNGKITILHETVTRGTIENYRVL